MPELSSLGPYVIPAISAMATLVGVVIAARKNTGLRTRIKEDAEVLAVLKEGSSAHTSMSEHIEWEIGQLRHNETVGERQWGFGIFAFISTAGLTVLSMWLFRRGGWAPYFLGLTVPLTMVFIYGMIDSFAKLPRDEKGNTIRDKVKSSPS